MEAEKVKIERQRKGWGGREREMAREIKRRK